MGIIVGGGPCTGPRVIAPSLASPLIIVISYSESEKCVPSLWVFSYISEKEQAFCSVDCVSPKVEHSGRNGGASLFAPEVCVCYTTLIQPTSQTVLFHTWCAVY